METYDKYVADNYYQFEHEYKVNDRMRSFHKVVYILLCVLTFGFAYLIRLIITEGVRQALWEVEESRNVIRYHAHKDKSE